MPKLEKFKLTENGFEASIDNEVAPIEINHKFEVIDGGIVHHVSSTIEPIETLISTCIAVADMIKQLSDNDGVDPNELIVVAVDIINNYFKRDDKPEGEVTTV